MGKYIKLFQTHSEYEAYIGGEDAFLPNVSYCEDINDVHYNPIVVGINTYISCVDIASGEELAGSHIQVLDQDGEVVEEWTSTTEVHEVEGLNKGTTYTLRTTVAPDGYVLATTTTLTIDGTGQITYSGETTTDEEGNTVLLVEMQITILKVSCTDIGSGEELEGSTIQILDSQGNTVEEWDSTTDAHEVNGLKTGEEYTLRNTVAPDGYLPASETTFSIDETGEVTTTGNTTTDEEGNTVLLVEVQMTQVQVLCVDVTDGTELAGSTIQILDSQGNTVEEWTSTTEAHQIDGLKTGETYTLHNTVASDGYVLATDTTFTINETGHVTSTGSTTTDEDGNTVLLVEMEMAQVQVSCTDIGSGEELEGSHIQVIDSEGTVVEEWDSTGEAHQIEGLKTGETYTLRTTVASEGFILPTDTTFSINENGEIDASTSTTTISVDGILLVELQKTILKVSCTDIGSGDELEGAHIQIIDSEGAVVEEWDSTEEPHTIEGLLTTEEYTLTNTVTPDGYLPTSDTTFSIDETGEVTSTGSTTTDEYGKTVLLVELTITHVEVSCVDAGTGDEAEGGNIQVLGPGMVVADEWTSGTEPHTIEGLNIGTTYTLRVTHIPEPYTNIIPDETFTIDNTGRVTSTGMMTEDGIMLIEFTRVDVNP